MSGPERAIATEELRFKYRGGERVLDGVSLAAAEGELVCILGANGCGKTTLLRCLMGWLRPESGRVFVRERPVEDLSPKVLARLVAYVPQFPTSAFAFAVSELVLMGRFAHGGLLGLPSKQDLAVVRLAMEMTGTSGFADRSLDELSGGESQRVMVARAIAQQPAILLLDEPTSHLDLRSQVHIHRLLQRIAHDWPMTVLCVSHEVNLAARFADQLILMKAGRVVASGRPEDVIRREILEETYETRIELVTAPGWPVPVVLPA